MLHPATREIETKDSLSLFVVGIVQAVQRPFVSNPRYFDNFVMKPNLS